MMIQQLQCRLTSVHEILQLRADELRSGKPIEMAYFPGDDLTTTLHFGGFIDQKAICCLTLLDQSKSEKRIFQLRGMATAQSWQGKGIGRALLAFAEAHLKNQHPKVIIWCNARVAAIPFYIRMGYRITSEPFMISGVGLHQKMEKTIL